MSRRRIITVIALVSACSAPAGEPDSGSALDAPEPQDGGLGLDTGHEDDAAATGCREAHCAAGGDGVFACGNCLDDDGDGLTDEFDPDCYGPCDTSEDAFFHLAETATDSCSQPLTCLFNFGRGGCLYSRFCYGEDLCTLDPARCDEVADAQCLAWCLPFVPNGCDCYGCCDVGGTGSYVRIRNQEGAPGACSMATLDDPMLCRPCTPSTQCFNACDPCELCVGRRLPGAGCTAEQRCGSGVQPCGVEGDRPCPDNTSCISGCCASPVLTL